MVEADRAVLRDLITVSEALRAFAVGEKYIKSLFAK